MNQVHETRKCRYFNQGYCKKKNNCKYIHPTDDCEEDCSNSKCPLRHRIICLNGDDCYYNGLNECEFRHDNIVQTIKANFKEQNRNLRMKIDELTKVIDMKDNEFREMQTKHNQILELNKNAF